MLGLGSAASADEIKKAFRQQIARYHPDKVHHLGREFQEMAAVRAAELTEAYRILSDQQRRGEYDSARPAVAPPPASAPSPHEANRVPPASSPSPQDAPSPPPTAEAAAAPSRFKQERATVDQFVRKATISRFRQALGAVGQFDDSPFQGFDIACVPKSKLFGRGKGPRVLGRFVARVDADTVADAWGQAGKWGAASDAVCVFLMGSGMAASSELAGAIAAQRKKGPAAKVTLIPVDARNWEAHVPTDAPQVAKDLLARLRSTV